MARPNRFHSPPAIRDSAAVERTSKRDSSSPSWWSVRASGTGRTTFVNTLCGSEVLAKKVCDNPDLAHVEEGIRIKPITVELDEDGVRISLTIVDTPGFGDNIDNELW
ncbi:Septin-domain-containing protein [Jimgerdemannia flammicorona]|uniref:Septin-domain-containing protein n=1 Tax=Jimgerdemannia flammicorona TaxID=994334 RepID=A0A433ACJ1_9FUNG|nr:Septin-domain-containing protein [Jimgerdemannia flammicorona]